MKRHDQLVLLLVALFVFSTLGIELLDKCSEFVKVKTDGLEPYTSLSLETFPPQLPVDLLFDQPVKTVKDVNNLLEATEISPTEWSLRPGPNLSLTTDEVSLEITAAEEPASVERIRMGKEFVCAENVLLPQTCGNHSDLVHERDSVLRKMSEWATGANYELTVASFPDYIGYRIDVFFHSPVKGFDVFDETVRELEMTPVHWVLLREFTDPACEKLTTIRFQLTFDNPARIESLFLNGNRIFGDHEPLQLLWRNDINEEAITKDCQTFFTQREPPWFGGEKAQSLWCSITFKPKLKAGLVIDFVFEEPIQDLRTWHFNVQNISGDHWRIYNPGWHLTPETTFRFHAIYAYFNHYHVKFKGIQVNGQVLCGLAAPQTLLIDHRHLTAIDQMEEQKTTLDFFRSLVTISLYLVAFNLIISVIIFFFILVRKLAGPQTKQLPFYAETTGYPSTVQPYATSDDTYATVNKGLSTEGEYVSHM